MITSSYAHGVSRRARERLEIELERAPRALEQRGMELADDACLDLRRLPRMQEAVASARAHVGSAWSDREQRLDDALHPQEAALRDRRRPDVRSSGSSPGAAGQIHPRDLEERDPLVPDLDVPSRGLEQRREELRPQDGELDRDRLRQPERVRIVASSSTSEGV